MKIIPVYENNVFVVPQDKVTKRLATATREELAVLLSVLSVPEFKVSDRAAALNLTEKTFLDALALWQRNGVLTIDSQTETEEKEHLPVSTESNDNNPVQKDGDDALAETAGRNKVVVKKSIHARRELPHYGSGDAADYLERHPEAKSLVDCCQNISGDMFSAAETDIIIGMHDYLALSPEYIMLLFAHAQKLGKKSVRYVETLAIRFWDEGITGYRELEERLQIIEKIASAESYIRTLFGLESRALIPKEKSMIEKWINVMHYDTAVIDKAYEVTITNTGKPSIAYANAVMENWYKAGLSTIEEIETSIAEYQKNHDKAAGQKPELSSFDTDDFFADALRRSYGD